MKLVVIGDSTSGGRLQQDGVDTIGWSEYLNDYLTNPEVEGSSKCTIGWGIRDYFNRKGNRLEIILSGLQENDILLASFGTLERAPLSRNDFGARGSLPGKDDRYEIVYDEHYKVEYKVYTYGEYLRRLAQKAKDRGIRLYFLSQVPRNTWQDGHHKRTYSIEYARITEEISIETGTGFLDINEILSRYLEDIGQERAKELYSPFDKSHTTAKGAKIYAEIILTELEKKYPDIFEKVA